ncbi:MAG: hypothetical protein A4E66_01301 [Syntrophus sp. PtaB.Bin001]|nr:MAG: hypothetical protein A4E66_01301 [Syntrophus sp. PtaB.Bin001]
MTELEDLYMRMLKALEIEGLDIPIAAIRFFRRDDWIPEILMGERPGNLTLTCCQAVRQAELGDSVLLMERNMGCVAAAISLGLVDRYQDEPLSGARVYTEIMREQSGAGSDFIPPTPKDFTDGLVYACTSVGRLDFCLFGKKDSGRFRDVSTARRAVAEMAAIQPPIMKGIYFYHPRSGTLDLTPDIVLLSLRPVELTRLLQGLQFLTGKRISGSMGGLRSVCSDLIARAYLEEEACISSYCLGSRLIARVDANRMGMGMPYAVFKEVVKGLEASRTGYPFSLYSGSVPCANNSCTDPI